MNRCFFLLRQSIALGIALTALSCFPIPFPNIVHLLP